MRRVLETLAADLKDRGKLDLTECYIDATFVVVKKGTSARKSRTPFRRAHVILHSAHGFTVQEIARVACLHKEYIRELIRQFNINGVSLFKERARSECPVEFVPEIRADIVEIALSPPKLLGRPFTHWSLEKLREHIVRVSVVPKISLETLRRILRRGCSSAADEDVERVK